MASKRGKTNTTGGFQPFVYALLVHVLVVAVLFANFRWSSPPKPVPEVIQAVVIDDDKAIQQAAEQDKRAAAEAEKKRKAEQDKRAAAEAEKKRKAEQAKRTAEAEKKRKAKQAVEKKRKDKEAKLAAERQRKEKALKDLLQQEEQQRQVEAQQRQAQEKLARAQSVIDQYKALIHQKVSRNWAQPAGSASGLACVVQVRLVASGEVMQATVVRSSGDPVFDRSVENAVYKAAPLPLPPNPDLFEFFREIEFTFRPEK